MNIMWKRLKHLFVPCEENSFSPHFLEKFSMGIMLFLILLTFAMANIQALVWIGSEWMVSSILPAVIVDLTNQERANTLSTLHRNTILDTAAKLKADDMAKNSYFAHYSPTGVSPWHWFDEAGYDYVYAGENLAVRFTDSGDVVDAWMKSPTHRANIMSGNYTEIGVGTAKGEYRGTPTIFVVQLFGTPRKSTSSSTIVTQQSANTSIAEISTTSVESMSPRNTNVLSEHVSQLETPTSTKPVAELVPENISSTTNESASFQATTSQPITETIQTNEISGISSSFASTSREGVPAFIDWKSGSTGISGTTIFERSVTQSSLWLQYLYGFFAVVVSLALIVSIVVEWRRQNPLQIAYAGGLLATMAFLFYVHIVLTTGVVIG